MSKNLLKSGHSHRSEQDHLDKKIKDSIILHTDTPQNKQVLAYSAKKEATIRHFQKELE